MKNCILIFCALINFTIAYSQKVDINKIYGRWVVNSKDPNINIFSNEQDTIEYIPFKSDLANDLHPALKYGGIRFEENGVFYKHVWNKCGTGNPPDFYEGTWELKDDEAGPKVIIKTTGQEAKFTIHYLDNDKLVLVARK